MKANSANNESQHTKFSRYSGVSPTVNRKRYKARVDWNRKKQYIGCFDTEIEAAIAHDDALSKKVIAARLKNEKIDDLICFNFGDPELEESVQKRIQAINTIAKNSVQCETIAVQSLALKDHQQIFKGITWRPERAKWVVQIKHDSVLHSKLFDTIADAMRFLLTTLNEINQLNPANEFLKAHIAIIKKNIDSNFIPTIPDLADALENLRIFAQYQQLGTKVNADAIYVIPKQKTAHEMLFEIFSRQPHSKEVLAVLNSLDADAIAKSVNENEIENACQSPLGVTSLFDIPWLSRNSEPISYLKDYTIKLKITTINELCLFRTQTSVRKDVALRCPPGWEQIVSKFLCELVNKSSDFDEAHKEKICAIIMQLNFSVSRPRAIFLPDEYTISVANSTPCIPPHKPLLFSKQSDLNSRCAFPTIESNIDEGKSKQPATYEKLGYTVGG